MAAEVRPGRTVTRAEVLGWPPEALTGADVFGAEDDESGDWHHVAWAWLRGELEDGDLGQLGARAHVRVCGPRTDGRWVRVREAR